MKKQLSCLLALLMLAFPMVSCQQDTDTNLTEIEPVSLSLDLSGYTILRGDLADPEEVAAAVALYSAISPANEISFATDWVKDESEIPVSAKEILIGQTNRTESKDVFSTLLSDEYSIVLNGERLVIIGGSGTAVQSAVDYFLANFYDVSTGTASIPEGGYTYKVTYPVPDLTIGGISVSEFAIIAGSDTDEALKLQEAIRILSGYLLPMSQPIEKPEYAIVLDNNNKSRGTKEALLTWDGARLTLSAANDAAFGIACQYFTELCSTGKVEVDSVNAIISLEESGVDYVEYLMDSDVSTVYDASDSIPAAKNTAVTFWNNYSAMPDETVQLLGGDYEENSTVTLTVLDKSGKQGTSMIIEPSVVSENTLMFTIPADLAPTVYEVTVKNSKGMSEPVYINAPDPWFCIGDEAQYVTTGGWLRVMGTSLSFDNNASLKLADASGAETTLTITEQDEYSITAEIPASLTPGTYTVSVSNGWGGMYISTLTVDVIAPPIYDSKTLTISPSADPSEDRSEDISALLNELNKAGGGTLYFEDGVYVTSRKLRVGKNIHITCASPNSAKIVGTNGEENMFILHGGSVMENLWVFQSALMLSKPAIHIQEDDVALVGVSAEINPWLANDTYVKKFSWNGIVSAHSRKNLVFKNCYLTGPGIGLYLLECEWVVIDGCTVIVDGMALNVRSTVRVCGVNNTLSTIQLDGSAPLTPQNAGMTIFLNYYKNNTILHTLFNDREAITYDDHGMDYLGGIESVSGNTMVLDGEVSFRDSGKTHHRQIAVSAFTKTIERFPDKENEWHGFTCYIYDGRGAGQYRNILAYDGNTLTLESPWDVEPDETSTVYIGPFAGRIIFDGNTIKDAGIGIQTYPPNTDAVMANNHLYRTGGANYYGNANAESDSNRPESGMMDVVEINWRSIGEDNIFHEGQGINGGSSSYYIGGRTTLDEGGYPAMGITLRNNLFMNHSHICLTGAVDSFIAERNIAIDSDYENGVYIQPNSNYIHEPRNYILRKNVDALPEYDMLPESGEVMYFQSTTTDTFYLQESIDKLKERGGTTLYLMPGTYRLTNQFVIPAGITVSGVQRGLVSFVMDSAETAPESMIRMEECSTLEYVSLNLTGVHNDSGFVRVDTAVNEEHHLPETAIICAANCTVNDVIIRATPYLKFRKINHHGLENGAAIRASGGSFTLTNSDIISYGLGVDVTDCDTVTLTANELYTSSHGYNLTDCGSVTIADTYMMGKAMRTADYDTSKMDAECNVYAVNCTALSITDTTVCHVNGGDRAAFMLTDCGSVNAENITVTDALSVWQITGDTETDLAPAQMIRVDSLYS